MTLQSYRILFKMKKLTNNSDIALRYDSDGMIYPFASDTPFVDCSKYRKEIISIMDSLKKKGYITASKNHIRLTQEGIHFCQTFIKWIARIIYDKFIPFCALIISIISLLKSFGFLDS